MKAVAQDIWDKNLKDPVSMYAPWKLIGFRDVTVKNTMGPDPTYRVYAILNVQTGEVKSVRESE